MKIKDLSLKDLAIVVSDYLRQNGIETVLSGGACVSIYSNNKFMSYDLDFVLISEDQQKRTKELLMEIGFYPKDRYFKHDKSPYLLDFVAPPPSVGNEPVKEIVEIKKANRILKLLSPTESVKDRLAAFYHWQDRQSLEQAVLVCLNNTVDFKEIERWSVQEGMEDKYQKFIVLLSKTNKGKSGEK
jgi:hypothetical protein